MLESLCSGYCPTPLDRFLLSKYLPMICNMSIENYPLVKRNRLIRDVATIQNWYVKIMLICWTKTGKSG